MADIAYPMCPEPGCGERTDTHVITMLDDEALEQFMCPKGHIMTARRRRL